MGNPADYLEYRLDSKKQLLYCRWTRDVNQAEYKAGLQFIYKKLVEHDTRLWLQDSTVLQPRTVAELKWVVEEFSFMLTSTSIKYVAVVTPHSRTHYAELRMIREKAYRIFGKQVLMEVFDTVEEALSWLLPNLQHYRLQDLMTPGS
ncbi:STAS/SEC14 domain-containing protein [Pontibacter burrus]|uniref:STAS/SEC14 domain-containing protein n=1 Tax=Pontibacter burrus TaxID=2704466 RepID=A0A6B3LL43_9BACT|nr:STAS/SEC14 domain-containing protein [Pontibacter burrus]NEM97652.1 hypothetical protein [Pontibacter burrus]